MRRSILAAVTVCLLTLAGCGGGTSKQVQAGPKQTTTTIGHALCGPSNYAMQCALKTVPAPTAPKTFSLTRSLYGVDFAWGGPRSCSAMHSLGAQFGAAYLSFDSGKNWTRSLVNEFHSCQVATVSVWETTQFRSTQGFAAGASDAINARAQAAGIGNVDGAITFAIDFDASGPDVISYFRGAQSVLGSRVNAYGGYRPLAYLHAHGAVGNLNWQTYAWSGGAWLPASIAPLEQYLNGNAFDNDRAIATNYGQFPAPQSGPSQATIRHWQAVRNGAFAQYRAHKCRYPQQDNQCRHIGAAIETIQHTLWTVYPKWALFGKRASHLHSAIAWVVRPEANYWTHAKLASQNAFQAHVCGGATGTQGLTHNCRVWKQRANWFGAHASALVKAYS